MVHAERWITCMHAACIFFTCQTEVRWKWSTREEVLHVYCIKQTDADVWSTNKPQCFRLQTGVVFWASNPSSPLMYSLAGPVVWYGPVQRDSVAEVRVVAILLSQVFSIALLNRRQSGRKAAFTSTPEALDQTQRFGQTCVRQTRLHVKKRCK